MEDKIFQIKAKLLYNKKEKENFWHCVLEAGKIAKVALAGQFVNVKVKDTLQPLLRRPFSIHRVKGLNIEILYEVLGKGTEIFSQRKPGDYLDIIGPLGNGFTYSSPARQVPPKADPPTAGTSSPVLVAGGMGVAPLLFLAEKLKGKKTIVLLGAKTKSQILCEKEFQELGCSVKIATDDGSAGFKGYICELLKEELRVMSHELSAIYACGPRPMLKEISYISEKYNIPAQISLEEHLACGIGACLGCAVNTDKGFRRVCKEGPVFEADQIIWE